ncbi:hypothetical protein BGY98DRAFT_986985, partial [Russula aff. rugulosa BPL654]
CYPGTSNTNTCPTRTSGGGIFTHGRATTTCGRLNWPKVRLTVKRYGIRLMTEILYICSPF